jgi:F-type H+-transporting ATPase subunit alpha
MAVSEMAITLHAVNKGFFDDVEVKKALEVEKQMHGFVKQKYAALVSKIETSKELDADAEQELTKAIGEFKATLA